MVKGRLGAGKTIQRRVPTAIATANGEVQMWQKEQGKMGGGDLT